jgi:hypothetical protein
MCRWVRIRWLNVDLIWEKFVKVGNHYLGLFTVYIVGVNLSIIVFFVVSGLDMYMSLYPSWS